MSRQIIEEVHPFLIIAGKNIGFIEPTSNSDGSKVIQAVFYHDLAGVNPNVMAGISVDGVDVAMMQPIHNYRSREAGYLDNKPCYFESGKRFRFEVRNKVAFAADFSGTLILIKEKFCKENA